MNPYCKEPVSFECLTSIEAIIMESVTERTREYIVRRIRDGHRQVDSGNVRVCRGIHSRPDQRAGTEGATVLEETGSHVRISRRREVLARLHKEFAEMKDYHDFNFYAGILVCMSIAGVIIIVANLL